MLEMNRHHARHREQRNRERQHRQARLERGAMQRRLEEERQVGQHRQECHGIGDAGHARAEIGFLREIGELDHRPLV
ncbi:hypothetical protein [Burkholderia gladioli]|uniref:hypothetical protein n=1 Tax=Burkholderia gladioli TaxID=28095 RepID=UPI0011B25C4D|nr:hypothetical protein [Burkholderia gladioli]MBJ9664536.1 hypothetical protein [Burkholderia gladioli]MBU9218983.1 hypothetical protein [Burkholderia gladioli]MDN7727282.1 hypothetical protein [Burkholderia gladioli]MDN7920308.1 hypothetical protein [Burkholderia gladioli]